MPLSEHFPLRISEIVSTEKAARLGQAAMENKVVLSCKAEGEEYTHRNHNLDKSHGPFEVPAGSVYVSMVGDPNHIQAVINRAEELGQQESTTEKAA